MKRWLAGLVLAGALALAVVSCRQDVDLGVSANLDAAGADAADAGTAE
jgi:hypothetical protein